jgi:hypothetical protein
MKSQRFDAKFMIMVRLSFFWPGSVLGLAAGDLIGGKTANGAQAGFESK